LLVLLLLAVLSWTFWYTHSKRIAAPLPPGPPADPIIGHVRLIPSNRPELTYIEWGKIYKTEIVYLNLMGQPVFILNKAEDAIALLEKRGSKYSSRPKLHFFEEMGWDRTLTMLTFGPEFRKHRRMFQNAFTTVNCLKYQHYQQQEARRLAFQIKNAPDKWRSEIMTFATRVILRIAYGRELTGDSNTFMELANKASEAVSDGGSAGATAVDIFPMIRYLPQWASFIPSLSFARKYYSWVRKMHDLPYAIVMQDVENGTAQESFVKKLIEDRLSKAQESSASDNLTGITDEDIKGAGAALYTGGADTTTATMLSFVLAMTLYPDIQRKAWAEIDSVVGKNGLPTFSDRQKLPYIEKVVQETFRWKPVVPLIVPHKTTEEDTYKGFHIPKGSLVIANNYAMTHDESIYSNPSTFNPDRYSSKIEHGAEEPFPITPFGFGRRICPGRHLGTASIWIAVATMLATLEISKAKDINGQEIEPSQNMSTGLTSHPENFPCAMKPRFSHISALIGNEL